MASHARQGEQVGLQARATCRVGGCEREYQGWRRGGGFGHSLTLETRPWLRAPSGGRYHHLGTVGATTTFYSTAPTFAYVLLDSTCRSISQDVALPRLRFRVRRGRRLARRRDRTGHSLGGHSGGVVLSRVRSAQGRFRNGGDLKARARPSKGLENERVVRCFRSAKGIISNPKNRGEA